MLFEKDFYAPLTPELLRAYEQNNHEVQYEPADDIWALGITSLCFLFNDDWRTYYDWSKRRIRMEKISQNIQVLSNMGFSQGLIRVVTDMLDPNNFTRVRLPSLYEAVNRRTY